MLEGDRDATPKFIEAKFARPVEGLTDYEYERMKTMWRNIKQIERLNFGTLRPEQQRRGRRSAHATDHGAPSCTTRAAAQAGRAADDTGADTGANAGADADANTGARAANGAETGAGIGDNDDHAGAERSFKPPSWIPFQSALLSRMCRPRLLGRDVAQAACGARAQD